MICQWFPCHYVLPWTLYFLTLFSSCLFIIVFCSLFLCLPFFFLLHLSLRASVPMSSFCSYCIFTYTSHPFCSGQWRTGFTALITPQRSLLLFSSSSSYRCCFLISLWFLLLHFLSLILMSNFLILYLNLCDYHIVHTDRDFFTTFTGLRWQHLDRS